MTTALLDGDVIAYKAASLCQTEIDWEDGLEPEIDVDLARGYRICRHIIDHWTYHVGASDYRIALTNRQQKCFRYRLHPHYKNHRVTAKPLAMGKMEEYLVKRHDAESYPGLEGDDLLGIWQTDPEIPNTTIVSPDKDMLTIPGRVFIVPHMKDFNESPIREVTEDEARYNLARQTILGDPVDTYAGAPGIGAKKVDGWLVGSHGWDAIVAAYEWAWEKRPRYRDKWVHPEDPEAEALMNLRCARILWHGDYDYEHKLVRLWAHDGGEEWLLV